jgi:hypothetical protein
MRHLSENFIKDLKESQLNSILEYLHMDDTLDLEIRENYINIYYRGGNILKISETKSRYLFHFEKKYLKNSVVSEQLINNHIANQDWFNYIPLAKQAMDFYFSKHKNEEKEFQQLVVRENNNSTIANGTDYFIIDIEYDNHENARFDLIAVEWPSEASKRKLAKNFKPKLAVIEMKFGDGAIKGKAGIRKHIIDFKAFRSNVVKFNDFKNEMVKVFNQKRDLGLIPPLSGIANKNQVTEFEKDIDLIFLIANHDPASKILYDQIKGIQCNNIKFITADFMGYGLYMDNLFDCSNFSKEK